MDPQLDSSPDPKSKPPVVRGARACTVCRAAKMKCVGAEDGQRQCQRCKRANVECIFEKHRRGRKPGSKLSEASKMLRRLEKGLNTAKSKSQPSESTSPFQDDEMSTSPQLQTMTYPPPASAPPLPAPPPSSQSTYTSTSTYAAPEQPPPPPPPPPPSQSYSSYASTSAYATPVPGPSRPMYADDDDDDQDRMDDAFIPAKLIKQESQRNSFFRTILNPEEAPSHIPRRSNSFTPPQTSSNSVSGLSDPITAGWITEAEAKTMFDAIFLRLNPFINLFDPALHTVAYIRSKSSFLLTVLVMAGCKFFKAERYKQCQKLVNEFAMRAFIESWKSVEVVQAFACMTYWKEPDDTRTWMFIGYACRMAVDLKLNRFVPNPPAQETDFQRMERRNRERTYLILFVHDRALSMQCNKQWMLPECPLVRNSGNWHEKGGTVVRPEDVIVAAQVSLRRIAAETEEIFHASKHNGNHNADINYEFVLTNCNNRLTEWDNQWQEQIKKANGGESFHQYFLIFFRLYVRIFLNSFAIQASMPFGNSRLPNLYALSACIGSALGCLRIASEEFREIHMLRYGQDSIATMTAYAALTLLKLLRDPHTKDHMAPVDDKQIHALILKTVEAYQDASATSPHLHLSISATFHSRFLRNLILEDIKLYKQPEIERSDDSMPVDTRVPQASPTAEPSVSSKGYPTPTHRVIEPAQHPYPYQTPPNAAHTSGPAGYSMEGAQVRTAAVTSPTPGAQAIHYPNGYMPMPQHATELDAHYWKNMFLELGFGENADQSMQAFASRHTIPSYMDQSPQHQTPHHPAPYPTHNHHQSITAPTPAQYHHSMHATAQQPYGH
ncbi:fungal-specific transcription factor domain-containing protein [Crepidotus variabilis]|uniref:Fungal-specific transcription factor domain-containing protein n=1 Tax=Crepidotus variabilis TaxID=179855 RepID=A0A9P6EP57_9AGAR|nr:fungal-specific transcription factor domain-containing protein [Crepidotus variabilis]